MRIFFLFQGDTGLPPNVAWTVRPVGGTVFVPSILFYSFALFFSRWQQADNKPGLEREINGVRRSHLSASACEFCWSVNNNKIVTIFPRRKYKANTHSFSFRFHSSVTTAVTAVPNCTHGPRASTVISTNW